MSARENSLEFYSVHIAVVLLKGGSEGEKRSTAGPLGSFNTERKEFSS
jgi:hypothetical protein